MNCWDLIWIFGVCHPSRTRRRRRRREGGRGEELLWRSSFVSLIIPSWRFNGFHSLLCFLFSLVLLSFSCLFTSIWIFHLWQLIVCFFLLSFWLFFLPFSMNNFPSALPNRSLESNFGADSNQVNLKSIENSSMIHRLPFSGPINSNEWTVTV